MLKIYSFNHSLDLPNKAKASVFPFFLRGSDNGLPFLNDRKHCLFGIGGSAANGNCCFDEFASQCVVEAATTSVDLEFLIVYPGLRD